MDAANPLDPNQFLKWQNPASDAMGKLTNMNLYDPAVMKTLRETLGPYFSQQMGVLNSAASRAGSQAGSSAGAYAASKNYANPLAFVQNAQKRVREQFAPQFEQLALGQTGQLFSATENSQKFQANTLATLAQLYQNEQQMKINNWYKQRDVDQAPKWYDYALGGLFSLGGQVAAKKIAG